MSGAINISFIARGKKRAIGSVLPCAGIEGALGDRLDRTAMHA